MNRRSLLRAGVSAGTLSAASSLTLVTRALAQAAFPSRPLRIFVPFAAGGPTDVMARGLSQKLTEALGQPVLVDNRPGGGAQIAAGALKQSPADGHTLMIGDIGALAINASLYQSLSYDALKDFTPLTLLMSAPIVLTVRADSPFKSMAEVVAAAKSGSRPVSFASQGVGTGGHLVMEMFKSMAGIEVAHVPYKGSAPAMQDILAGQVDALFELLPVALTQAQAGKVRLLAIAAPKRSSLIPDVATTAELGFAGLSMEAWFAAVTLAGTPDAAVRRLSAELGKAIRDPAVNKRFVDQGFNVDPGTPEQLGSLMKTETERWGVVVKRSGARAD